jgi:hypothetical protein
MNIDLCKTGYSGLFSKINYFIKERRVERGLL